MQKKDVTSLPYSKIQSYSEYIADTPNCIKRNDVFSGRNTLNTTNTPISDYKYTNYVSEALSLLEYKESEDEEFLLIIGNSGTKNISKYFGYKPYLYNSKTMKFESKDEWN